MLMASSGNEMITTMYAVKNKHPKMNDVNPDIDLLFKIDFIYRLE